MEPEDFEKLLEQSKTLAKKLRDANEELEKLFESIRTEGIITLTSAKSEQIAEKRKELDEVCKELREINDRILKLSMRHD
jgi:uncharacterized coiled-coil DUF342 family protein